MRPDLEVTSGKYQVTRARHSWYLELVTWYFSGLEPPPVRFVPRSRGVISALSKDLSACLTRNTLRYSMKKFFLLPLFALLTTAMVRAEISRTEAVERVETCEAILQEFQGRRETAIPANVLQRAKAIIILNQFKAGFLFGLKDGYGVIMVRRPDNSWSIPVLVRAAEASVGLQVGANSVESIYVVTDPNLPRLLFKGRVNLGAEARAVAGPHEASKEKNNEEILKTPVLVYTRAVGLYAGATIKLGTISRHDEANFTLYRTRYTMPELLYGDFVAPVDEVRPIRNLVQRIAP